MTVGGLAKEDIGVRSAMTFFPNSFMNVGNAASWHVGGVDSTAFEAYEDEVGFHRHIYRAAR